MVGLHKLDAFKLKGMIAIGSRSRHSGSVKKTAQGGGGGDLVGALCGCRLDTQGVDDGLDADVHKTSVQRVHWLVISTVAFCNDHLHDKSQQQTRTELVRFKLFFRSMNCLTSNKNEKAGP